VIADRAAGFGMPGVRVENGHEVLSVYDAVSTAVERARRGEGPSLVEVVTYRYNEHSEGLRLSVDYRDAEEKALWQSRDPIVLFRDLLVDKGIATAEELDAIDAEVRQEVEESVKFTDDSPFPEPERAFADLYTVPFGPTHSEHGRGVGVDAPIGHPTTGAVR
jgi:acetoin:2,6-dichlorophenolindophenol oxidoreductase subunit alpha